MMQDFASNIRGSVIKDSGHWIAEEQSEELTRQLLAFLSESGLQNHDRIRTIKLQA
jgi:pimeloyl-ACP methyl ester carboxylesterase